MITQKRGVIGRLGMSTGGIANQMIADTNTPVAIILLTAVQVATALATLGNHPQRIVHDHSLADPKPQQFANLRRNPYAVIEQPSLQSFPNDHGKSQNAKSPAKDRLTR
jgi:hypothetical protein